MTVNWSVVAVVMSAVALIVSSLILQGQTNSRIDAVRTEVLNRVDAVDTGLNGRIDATRTEVLAEVRALRDKLEPLDDGDLSAIHSDLAAIKQLLEQNITGANVQ